ncbi:hypothetical protein HZA97_10215 [Candidatus Woesearchaeota archaeon]|nr:hypothetical protein [Candidatus Woesearchaeota archaeon]
MKKGGLFYFAIYELLISLLAVINGLSNWVILINSIIGIVGAILVFCDRKEGFAVSLLWSVLQIPILQLVFSSGTSLLFNMQQVLTLYFSFYVTSGGIKYLIGINLIGLILTLILLTIRKRQKKENTDNKNKKKKK